jgi:hypothetical protein
MVARQDMVAGQGMMAGNGMVAGHVGRAVYDMVEG